MARTELTVQQVVQDGTDPSFASAIADGHSFAWSKVAWVHVVNDDASSKTITIPTPQTVAGLAVADHTVDVPAGEERLIGPFARDTFRQSDGQVHIDYSATTSVTVAVFRI